MDISPDIIPDITHYITLDITQDIPPYIIINIFHATLYQSSFYKEFGVMSDITLGITPGNIQDTINDADPDIVIDISPYLIIDINSSISPDIILDNIIYIIHAILYQSSFSAERKTLRLIVSQAISLTLLYVLLSTLFQRLYSTLS